MRERVCVCVYVCVCECECVCEEVNTNISLIYIIIHYIVHDIQPFGTKKFNMTHVIHHLSFGEDYPGQRHPLDGYTQVATEDPPTGEMMSF